LGDSNNTNRGSYVIVVEEVPKFTFEEARCSNKNDGYDEG